MKKKKMARLLEPGMQLYFLVLLAFTVGSAFFSPYLAAVEAVVLIAVYWYFRKSSQVRRREILAYIEAVTGTVDGAAKDSMLNSPLLMVIFRPEKDEVIWSNERFSGLTGAREHLFDTKLSSVVPGFSSRWLLEGKTQHPGEVMLSGRSFLVFGNLLRTGERAGGGLLAVTYWVDVTELAETRARYEATRPVVALLLLDNYEDLTGNLTDSARSAILSEIDRRLADWAEGTHGILRRMTRDRYLFLFEEQYLADYVENKFGILDSIHEVQSPDGIQASLSIGIGKDAPTLSELAQYAALSIEMALSRGGDQAVVKNRFNFEFFGGRSKELEKRTKVKSRVMANALGELVADASQIFVMGHKHPDLDSIGAAAGVCAIARKRGVPAYIVRDPDPNPAEVMTRRLAAVEEYQGRFLSPQDALLKADSRSLLVVVDTNRPEQVQAEAMLESCNKIAVIDHHRRAASYIANAALNFHEPYASSACELVAELLPYIVEPADILRAEAEALLAGIVLDTKNFTMRTGGRTFEAAAFLRRCGADTAEVKKLFQNDLEGTLLRYGIVQTARMVRDGVALARAEENVGRVVAAQAADELLNIAGIETSFVLFPEPARVVISARSIGQTNVQVILEKLGGGGNGATAGAQVPDVTTEEATARLLRAINEYFEQD